ncbi:MAG: DegT/DnrJ/EryC1/StrS aminotransferase family protein [Treponema sp.]|jgi:dTDP-4-amino-4,6-dideoxygalactose transaminase|nr:DegT/DnrJ/EryC1/StrS aminotransferase family protein [Treponema sp.]
MEIIPFAKPYIGKEEEEAVLAVLRSGWLTTGNETAEFEKDFADFLKTGEENLYCMAVNSATSGLHLALEAIGIGKGDLVLVPSLTFTATAEVVRYLDAEVVFVDVIKNGFHMDPAALDGALSGLKGAKAIIPVHYGGLPCDMDAIMAIAKKHNVNVVEDAAHSFPSLMPSGWAGLMGSVGVFSFYATKTISTGEGGMVVTRDKTIADRVKIMRSHGIDRSIWDRYTDVKASWYYEVIAPGFKYNISDILSALGRVQLRRAMELLSMRKEIARMYDEAFSKDRHFFLPPTGFGDARHLYPLRLNQEKLAISRNEFAGKIQEQGVGISVHFIPLHTMPYYKNRYSLKEEDFPETMKTYNSTISLPIWPGMTKAQTDRVIKVVKNLALDYNR